MCFAYKGTYFLIQKLQNEPNFIDFAYTLKTSFKFERKNFVLITIFSFVIPKKYRNFATQKITIYYTFF